MVPDSSGCRSTSSTADGNSGASSRNSTPWEARAAAPGRMSRLPPPTIAAAVAVWCGASKGGRHEQTRRGRIRRAIGSRRPRVPHRRRGRAGCRAAATRASSCRRRAARAGRGDARPPRRRACASTASSLPLDVGEVAGRLDLVSAAVAASRRHRSTARSSYSPPCQIAASSSDATPTTRMPATSAASAALPAGTITVSWPARAAASTAGRMPSIGRSRPSSPSSPRCTTRSTDSAETSPAAARHAIAMARSNPEPCFGSAAGERFTVRLARGQRAPGVHRRRAHAIASLAESGIGQSDDHERGQLRRDVGLDLDDRTGEARAGRPSGCGRRASADPLEVLDERRGLGGHEHGDGVDADAAAGDIASPRTTRWPAAAAARA